MFYIERNSSMASQPSHVSPPITSKHFFSITEIFRFTEKHQKILNLNFQAKTGEDTKQRKHSKEPCLKVHPKFIKLPTVHLYDSLHSNFDTTIICPMKINSSFLVQIGNWSISAF